MASNNVIGSPVTEGTRVERAATALNNPNEGGKRDEAIAYVRNLKQNWGTGVSTLCVFYNATGDSLLFAQEDSWYGQISSSYPVRVQNGQWGAYLHTKTPVAMSGSVGLVVYRVRVTDTEFCKQVISWQTPWGQVRNDNQAYCDVFADNAVISPKDIYDKMGALNVRQHSVMKNGMFTTAAIETGTSPLYEALFTIDSVAKKTSVDQEVEPTSTEEVQPTSTEEVQPTSA